MRVALIGTGNLATHLVKAFEVCNDLVCVQWIGRKAVPPYASTTIAYYTSFQPQIETDVCLLAISDDQIETVAQQLPNQNMLVAHTSGAVSKNVLMPAKRKGVFYPVQSFLRDKAINWKEIPICIEAESETDETILRKLASFLTEHISVLSENQRLHLHTAAVFANNFCTHLLGVSQSITEKSQLPFTLLEPLIKETFRRSFAHQANEVQTGPAKRNDMKTQEKHIAILTEEQTTIYQMLSQSIFNTFKA